MKVLLVRPKFSTASLREYPPFNLITLAPYFRGEVAICDLQTNVTLHPFLHKDLDVVGFTCFSDQLTEVDYLAGIVKCNIDARIIAGGSGVTADPEYAKRQLPHVDTLVAGDGEHFVAALNNTACSPWQIFKSPLYHWDHHQIPSWDLIDFKRYLKFPGAAVETSRGCPRNCVMCSAHLICGKNWRARKPIDIVQEIRCVQATYGFNLFYFPDDNATVDPRRWKALMRLIVIAKLNISLHAPEGLEAHHLTFETLRLMQKAGFKHITIGAESGVQRVLDDVIHKSGLKVSQIESVVRDCKAIGLGVNCFFIIGTPGETYEEAEATVAFAEKMRRLGAYSCMVRNTIPIPGTPLFRIASDNNYLTDPSKLRDSDFIHSGKHLLETPEWKPEQIEALVKKAQSQDARHILKNRKAHLLKKGIVRLIRDPRAAVTRLTQLVTQARK